MRSMLTGNERALSYDTGLTAVSTGTIRSQMFALRSYYDILLVRACALVNGSEFSEGVHYTTLYVCWTF